MTFQTTLCVSCFILLAHWASGQTLPFRTYTSEQGFIAGEVTSLCQDSRGYLWIGTGDGINIYDGTFVRTLTVANGLALNHITQIAESHHQPGKMLIGTWGGGVSIWQNQEFSNMLLDTSVASNTILDLDEDYAGRIWCATRDGLYRAEHGRIVRVAQAEGSTSIFIAPDSLIWVGGTRSILVFSAASDSIIRRIPLAVSGDVLTLHGDRRGNVWVTTTDSALIQLGTSNEVRRYRIRFGVVGAIAEDPDGTLWLGTENGLLRFSPEAFGSDFVEYTVENGLLSNRISACLVDHEATLWVGSSDATGLQQLAHRNVMSFPLGEPPPSYNNTKAVTDTRGHIWAITQAGLWETWKEADASWRQHLHRKQFARDGSMHTIVCDRRGRMWIDTGEQIECYEVEPTASGPSRLKSVMTLRPGIDLPEEKRFFFVVDSEENVWVSILGRGVYKREPLRGKGSLKHFSTLTGLPSNDIRAMQEDRRRRMWIGTVAEGIVVMEIERDSIVQRYTAADGAADNLIRAFAHDRFGRTWVGTRRKGVSVHDGKSFTKLSVERGLSSASVWALVADDSSRYVWAGTSQGVQQLDMENVRTVQPLIFLQGKAVTSLGTYGARFLWFVTENALIIYEYGAAAAPRPSPRLHITGLTVSGQAEGIREAQEFPHDRNHVTFEYVGVTFREPKAVRYQCRISPLEDEWQSVSSDRSVTYASLPPGSYTFHVRATGYDGMPIGVPDSLSFTIVPPFWTRWWFIALCVLVGSGTVAGIVRARVRRLLEIERLRTGIARNLHDEIGSNLSSIAMASDLLKRQSGLGEKEQQKLSEISSVALNTVKDMKDIVWLIKPENDSLDDLLLRMKDTAASVLEGCQYALNFPDKADGRKVSLDWRQHVYLIFKEALTNIARHASASRVMIVVSVDADVLTLTIEDNGKGFVLDSARVGNGLRNMRERADALKAEFSIHSAPAHGTTMSLRVRIT